MAGGNGQGNDTRQLKWPYTFDLDDDNQSIVIANYANHRITEGKMGEINEQWLLVVEIKEVDWINWIVQSIFSSTKTTIVFWLLIAGIDEFVDGHD